MGKYTEQLGGKYSQVLQSQPSKEDGFGKLFPKFETPKVGHATPEFLLTPQKIKESVDGGSRDIADISGQPDDYYASLGNAKFFSQQFHITPQQALKQTRQIGSALYNNKNLTDFQINKLIESDIKDGNFDLRARMAKWTQYGVTEDTAKELDGLYHSDWMDNLRFWGEVPVGGLAKALFGTVAGTGDLIGVDTKFSDDLLANIEESQMDHLNDALLRGDYGEYAIGTIGKTAGDVGGNLWLMGKAIKAANAYTGGKLTLAAKGKTWKALAANTAKRSTFLAGLNFVRTPGSLTDKTKAFGVTMAYMNTPIISSMSPTHLSAFVNDFILNSGITIGTGQYKDVWDEAHEIAEGMGRPDDAKKIFVGMAIPLLGSDVAFSALTRSVKQTQQTGLLRSFVEGARVIEQKGAVSVSNFEGALKEKYGGGWEQSMSEADRTRYNALQTANDAIKSGGISEESLKTAPITTQARIEIENDKVYYRDQDGTLRDIKGEEPTPIMDKVDVVKPEQEVVTPLPKNETIITPTTKGLLDSPSEKEFSLEMKNALAGLEKALASDKRTETIKTDADVGTGEIGKEATDKVRQKSFKKEKQMVTIDSMNIIKDRIRAMQEGTKIGKKLGANVEKAKQELRRAKETAKLKEMNAAQKERYNKRIATLEEKHKEAKRQITEKQKERKAQVKDIVDHGIKVVNDVTKDADIRNKFKVKAKSLKTEKGLASFLDDLNRFVEADADSRLRSHYQKKILKPVSDSTSYEQAKALKGLQQKVLLPKGKKAQAELDSINEYLKNNPDAKLPPKLKSKLEKTSLNKLSTDELGIVAAEMDRLRAQGRVKFKLEHSQRKQQNADDAELIKATMKNPKEKGSPDISGKPTGSPSLKFEATRPDRFYDMLDGARGTFKGLAHKLFIDNSREARAKFNEMKDARLAGGERLISDLGMSVKDFNKKVQFEVNGSPVKLTLEQMIGVYAGSKNRLNRAAILHGNFKGDEVAMNLVIKSVAENSKLKTIADYIIYDFANNTGRVFDSVGRNEGKVLDLEEYYIPMRRSDVEQKTSIDEMHNDVIGRNEIVKQLPSDKFSISRKDIPDSLQKDIDLNLLSLWEREVGLQEHYIAQMPVVKKMRGVLESGDFADNLKNAYGGNAPQYVKDHIDVVANPMSIYQHDGFSKVSRRLRKNIATAYLAGNVKTMIKQFPSLALYSGEVSPARLASSLAEVTAAFEQRDGRTVNNILDFVSEKDPLVKHSHIQRELDELRLSDKGKYDQFMNKVGEAGFKGILQIDRLARSAGWYAVYKKAIESGKSEDESIRLARNATARTQPTASAEELPPLYRKNEALNWMLMFSNQLNQIYNMSTKDVPRRILRGDMKEKIAGFAEAGGLAMTAMTIWAINNGRLPESPEEVADAMSEQAVASIPAIGSHIVNGMHGYDSAIPVVEFANETGKFVAKTKEGEMTAEEFADYTWRNVAPGLGIPVVALGRTGEAFKEKDPLKITGIKKKTPKKKKSTRSETYSR